MEGNKRETGRRKLSRKKKAAAAAAVIAAVALCSGLIASGRRSGNSSIPENVIQGTVERGDIQETVTGTGSLAADDSTEVTAPVGIEVEKVFVKSGDTVHKGDQIATVSELSVKEQLLSIQDSIDSLQDEIDDLDPDDDNYSLTKEVRQAQRDDLIETRSDIEKLRDTCVITANADGIVDQVYIEDGEEITGTGISSSTGTGDISSIDLSSLLQGRSEEGGVSSNDKTAVRISPDTASIPQTSGSVSAAFALDGGSDGGSDVGGSPENSDGAGDAAGAGQDSADEPTVSTPEKNEQEENITEELPTAANNSAILESQSAGSTGSQSAGSSGDAGNSNSTAAASGSSQADSAGTVSASGSTDLYTYAAEGVAGTGIYGGPVIFHVEAPAAGAKPQSSVELPETMHSKAEISWSPSDSTFKPDTAYTATVTITADEGYYFIDSVKNNSGQSVRALYVIADTCPGAEYTAQDLDGDGRTDTLSFILPYAKTAGVEITEQQLEALRNQLEEIEQKRLQELKENAGQIAGEAAQEGVTSALKVLEDAGLTKGTLANLSTLADNGLSALSTLSGLVSGGTSGLNANSLAGLASGLSGLNTASLSGLSSLGSLSGLSGLGSLSGLSGDLSDLAGAASAGSTLYSDSRAAVITVIPTQKMLLDIDVDELDINSVETGQTAQVTLDAIGDRTFEGTITSVASTAENTGGSGVAKYKVSLEIEKTQEMKFGMSATAEIDVDSRTNVLLIPIDALQSDGDGSVVYTSVDKDGNLSDPVSVETGLSTSETVEITSGMKEGDTFYYIPSNGGGSVIDQYREEQQETMDAAGNGSVNDTDESDTEGQ